MGKKLQIVCPYCQCIKRSDKLKAHLQSDHNKTPEEAKEIRNSFKSKNRVRARKPQSQEPALEKKPRIDAPPTNIIENFVKGLKIDARQCQGVSQEV